MTREFIETARWSGEVLHYSHIHRGYGQDFYMALGDRHED